MKKITSFVYFLLLLFACQTPPKVEIPKDAAANTSLVPNDDFAYQEWTIDQVQNAFEDGSLTITQLVQAYLDRIAAIDDGGPMLNAVIQVNPEALDIAAQLDKELKAGKRRGPLHGIPILLKDNIDTHDQMETTAGSRALQGSKPLQDSWVATKLRAAGAVIIGKANLSEWANFRGERSSSGWSGIGGQTHNPYITERNPCGSSSGSGAAVAANLAMLAIGTETNGSIVCPSSANGIVGIKPTVGLLSRSGIIPISFTQDTPGPMARTVRDAAICLGTMVGIDEKDSKTKASEGNAYEDYTQFLKADGIKGKRIGLYKKPLGIMESVDQLTMQAVEFLKSQGAEIVEIEQIFAPDARKASFEVMLYEYKDGLNEYFASLGDDAPIKSLEELIEFNKNDPVEMTFYQQEYLELAQAKGDLKSDGYKVALHTMAELSQKKGIDKVMDDNQLDAIIAPTGSPAWKTDHENGDKFHLGSSSPAAMAGYPNITLPMGFVDELPVGLSFFGRAWSEPTLLEIVYAYEQGTKHRKAPKFLKN
ncbi:MAG: amidase [Bacteroidota bacterium]